jgi:hypothetical protein
MRDPIVDLKRELMAAAERRQQHEASVGAGRRRLHASSSRERLGLTAATAAVVAAAALVFTAPWSTSPGFLEEVQATLTPPAGSVLHFKLVMTENRVGCEVTHPPIEYWIDLTPPHRWRGFEVQQTDICTAGTSIELGGEADSRRPTLVFRPPNTLATTKAWPADPDLRLDTYGEIRQAIEDGTAHRESRTVLDNGRTVERIRIDCDQAKFPGCGPMYWFVDPETFLPVRTLAGPGLRPGPGATCTAPCFAQDFVTYEYLPGTPANRALADIRAQHPKATER